MRRSEFKQHWHKLAGYDAAQTIMQPTTKKLEFLKPFDGRPSRMSLLGPFCLSPDVYLKLFGVSINAALEAHSLGNHLRRLERWKSEPPKETVMARTMHEILDAADVSQATGEALSVYRDLREAASGDPEAKSRVEARGFMEMLLFGLGNVREEWGRRHRFLVVLEAASRHTGQLLQAGDMAGAAAYMEAHPLLNALLWSEALETLRNAKHRMTVFPVTYAMLLDAHLGWLAALDIDSSEAQGLPVPQFAGLLPSHEQPGRNPTSLLFDAFKRRVGLDTAAAVLQGAAAPADVSADTVYRWSAGMHFPEVETVSKLLEAHGITEEPDIFHRQFSAAKLLNLLGHVSEDLVTRARMDGEPPCRWPWPDFPFGYPDFESWAATRYPFWLDYLRENKAALTSPA